MRDKDDDDRDDIDDVEDERLSLQDMKGMRERFVHYLARLDERINFAAAQEKTAIANDKKEIDWLEEHVADAGASHPTQALRLVRDDLGDCTRCKLHQQGRKRIVFGVGNPRAELMFVGEGPGADDDAQGEPFVGRAGQLLNNMIKAMGLRREDVYIANVVKCRPPRNRMPEHDECETCSPFLMRQIAVIKPKVVVALGAVAVSLFLNA